MHAITSSFDTHPREISLSHLPKPEMWTVRTDYGYGSFCSESFDSAMALDAYVKSEGLSVESTTDETFINARGEEVLDHVTYAFEDLSGQTVSEDMPFTCCPVCQTTLPLEHAGLSYGANAIIVRRICPECRSIYADAYHLATSMVEHDGRADATKVLTAR